MKNTRRSAIADRRWDTQDADADAGPSRNRRQDWRELEQRFSDSRKPEFDRQSVRLEGHSFKMGLARTHPLEVF